MRVEPDTCRDPDLLAAEVRRLRGVIAASQPTLTDDEREALESPARIIDTYDGPVPVWSIRNSTRSTG